MSLMSDVMRLVKHPPTCTIHSPFTGGLKSSSFVKSKMCANIDMLCMYVIQFGRQQFIWQWCGEREGLRTDCSSDKFCGGIMHDMLMKLKKGSWCVSLSKAQHLQLYIVLMQCFQPCLPSLRLFHCSAFVGTLAVCSQPGLPSRGLFHCSAHASSIYFSFTLIFILSITAPQVERKQ